MADTIAVVKPRYRLEEAYRMGYGKFEDAEVGDPEQFDLSAYHGSAEYSNHVLPDLRAMAGFDDSGYGTYTQDRKVAAVELGCEEDEPAPATIMDAHSVFERLVDAFNAGVYDAVAGDEPNAEHVVW